MTPLGWIIILICIFAGIVIGNFISKRFPNLFSKFTKEKGINKVLKDPHLLVEKLKSHGEIYDMGKRLDIKVGQDNKTGQDVVVVEEIKVKKAKELQKKIAGKIEKKEPKTKKKIKKRKYLSTLKAYQKKQKKEKK